MNENNDFIEKIKEFFKLTKSKIGITITLFILLLVSILLVQNCKYSSGDAFYIGCFPFGYVAVVYLTIFGLIPNVIGEDLLKLSPTTFGYIVEGIIALIFYFIIVSVISSLIGKIKKRGKNR